MATIKVTVTLSKEVPDIATGDALIELAKARFADSPDVKVNGLVTKRTE